MSSKNSAEFKAKVALEALAHNIGELHDLAGKYHVTENEIISWVDQLKDNASIIFTDKEEATATAAVTSSEGVYENYTLPAQDQNFQDDFSRGVSDDRLNLKRITKWFVGGALVILIAIILLVQFAHYAVSNAQNKVSEASQFQEITNLNKEQNEILHNFGVIDADKGIYHIPIDKAIEKVAID